MGRARGGAWIINWIMSTRPWSIGTVTAGTATQLEERTWAALRKMTKLCITADWWEVQSGGIYIQKELCRGDQTSRELEGGGADLQGGKRAEFRGPARRHQHVILRFR
jgi:hypothetical protein